MCSSRRRCSSRSCDSSRVKRATSGSIPASAASAARHSSVFCAHCARHHSKRAFASPDLTSARCASSVSAASLAFPEASSAWMARRRRSTVSKRAFAVSTSERSKRVAPSRAASEFTERLPFFAIASPARVTILQDKPSAWASVKAKRRPSAMVSATTTSPSKNSKARAKRSSKATQFKARRSELLPPTNSSSRGSAGVTRRSPRGKNVIGGSIRSFKYLTHCRATSPDSTTTASRNFPMATFTATWRRFCEGRHNSITRPCTPGTAFLRFAHVCAI
mmetsp:Transcript_81832/g.227950  ORF Transcript_81832/g.227950 Transcript_81832/m.227950 type:complete len:277 (+) Transcript_81832:1482-2312(+)